MKCWCNKVDISVMHPIAQKIDSLIKSEGYTVLECGQSPGKDNITVNEITYINKNKERIYITTQDFSTEVKGSWGKCS